MRGSCNERQTRHGNVRSSWNHEPQMWRLFASSPKAVEYCSQFMGIEGDPVRFMGLSGRFHDPWKLRQFFNNRKLGRIGE